MPIDQEARRILHVLPHPGGGGETYVDVLAGMDGYALDRAFLADGANPAGARTAIIRNAVGIQRRALAYDVVHVHGEIASLLCLPALGVRSSVVTLHGLNLLRRSDGTARTAARISLATVVRAASRTICVSEAERDNVVCAIGAHFAPRLAVIHNGVEPARVDPELRAKTRSELGLPEDRLVGVWLGSLDEVKDPLTAIRAAIEADRAGAQLTLLVVGDGPLRTEVDQAAQAAGGAEAVRVLGFRTDAGDLLTAADFFVLTSAREGLSFSLLEAMSEGLVPVVSDAPGNVEATGDAGIVVGHADVAGYAAAFKRLASAEGAPRDLGKRARARTEERFTAGEMRRRTRAVYDEVIEQHSRRRWKA